MYNTKKIGNVIATLTVKVNMSIWDAFKIRISGLPAIDKILNKKKESLIDINFSEEKIKGEQGPESVVELKTNQGTTKDIII